MQVFFLLSGQYVGQMTAPGIATDHRDVSVRHVVWQAGLSSGQAWQGQFGRKPQGRGPVLFRSLSLPLLFFFPDSCSVKFQKRRSRKDELFTCLQKLAVLPIHEEKLSLLPPCAPGIASP